MPTDPKYFVKIRGPVNEACNIEAFNGKYSAKLSAQELDALPLPERTYQTVIAVAYLLRARDAIERYTISTVAVPDTYLYHVPGRPEELSDNNYLVLQKTVANGIKLEDIQAGSGSLDDKKLRELFIVPAYAGLWSFKGNIMVADNQLVLPDLEQPNNSNPLDFYHQNRKAYEDNVATGIKELVKIVQPEGCLIPTPQCTMLAELTKQNRHLWSTDHYYNHLVEFFNDYCQKKYIALIKHVLCFC